MLLREATADDVPLICALEQRLEYYGLIGAWSAEEHLRCIADPEWRYFITDQAKKRAGFSILCGISSPHKSIELKRIVVASAGQGLGKEMLRQIIRKVFDEYGAHRLWLDVFEDNVRAQRAYAAAGLLREGVLREAVYRDGGYHSLILMSILEQEYRSRPPQREGWNSAKAAP